MPRLGCCFMVWTEDLELLAAFAFHIPPDRVFDGLLTWFSSDAMTTPILGLPVYTGYRAIWVWFTRLADRALPVLPARKRA